MWTVKIVSRDLFLRLRVLVFPWFLVPPSLVCFSATRPALHAPLSLWTNDSKGLFGGLSVEGRGLVKISCFSQGLEQFGVCFIISSKNDRLI